MRSDTGFNAAAGIRPSAYTSPVKGLRIGRPSAEKSPRRHGSIGTVGFRSVDALLPLTVSPETNQNVRPRPLYNRGTTSGPPTARPGKWSTPAGRWPENGFLARNIG